MTFYSFLSTILSYVFTLIIYLFIFAVIRLIYLDVRKMSRFEENNADDMESASLKPLKTKIPLTAPLKNRYVIYDEAVIGRSRNCDITINEDFISSKHVRIWFDDGEWYLSDLDSRNGTFVNGKRILDTVILDPEDEISLGGLKFVFEI